MEIMGLAFVVILITLGLLFYIRFTATKEPSQVKETFTTSQKAANMLNSLIKTNTYCAGATITQLLQDCAENKDINEIFCSITMQESCEFIESTMIYIFSQTLDTWGDDYYLKACLWNTITQQCYPDETILSISPLGSECSSGLGQRESSSQFIPVNGRVLKIWLDICK